jgi:hypothetical protein
MVGGKNQIRSIILWLFRIGAFGIVEVNRHRFMAGI